MLRPVRGEAAEDGDGVRGGGRIQGAQVLLPVLIAGQEVIDRPVMPGMVMAPGLPAENVGGQPVDLASPRPEAIPRVPHPGCGDVEHGQVTEAAIQQRPGQRDAPPPTSMTASAAETPAASSIRSDMPGCSSNQLRVPSPRA